MTDEPRGLGKRLLTAGGIVIVVLFFIIAGGTYRAFIGDECSPGKAERSLTAILVDGFGFTVCEKQGR